MRRRKSGLSLRRVAFVLGVGTIVAILVVSLAGRVGIADSFPMPGTAALAGLSEPQRIVAIVTSQVGYSTEPSHSYCNKYSAYWDAGTSNCPNGETAEEWCADFAAWAWQRAGVSFTYGYAPGEINGAAVSFYEWAVANGEWHPATSGYVATPGDVAVYGLSIGKDPSALHVAIVTSDAPNQRGPDVVNGDGDRTGFSVVESGTDQVFGDAGDGHSVLSGFVSPP
jgi:CHAP domain